MKLQIDNLDGMGPRDYTAAIDAAQTPRITRKLNQPSELRFSLLLGPDLVVPRRGSRVLLGRTNGQDVFTGYIVANPEYEFLGWGEKGPLYRFNIVALSDEILLDEKRLPARSPFVARSAGDALRELTEEALGGVFDTTAVQNLDPLPEYEPDPQLPWTTHAATIAIRARASYRVMNGAVCFAPLGASTYALREGDATFAPQELALKPAGGIVNDVTVVGEIEPHDYVRDYFVGDGLTTRFHLSQSPYSSYNRTVFTEEYLTLDPTRWQASDPMGAIAVSMGKLQISGGNGVDGGATLRFVEPMELGGAWIIQHGDVAFTGASSGILGGLYLGAVAIANCIAGFRVSPAGSESQIQALVNGAAVGPAITTAAGHHYVLTTRVFSSAKFRQKQVFHSAQYCAGNAIGGEQLSADARLVLEVHDIDSADPASMVAPSMVLYDNVMHGAPAYCTYALVNSLDLHCEIAFSRLVRATDVEVRSALPGQPYRTRLVGPLSAGGECNVYSGPMLDFFNPYVPALNEQIEVRYRGYGRAMARVTNPVSIANERRGLDDGVRGVVRHVKAPPPRTSMDCENAALAILSQQPNVAGEYQAWSDFLPGGATDVFPGDGLSLDLPSRSVALDAIVNEVVISTDDLAGDHFRYIIRFIGADDSALAFEWDMARTSAGLNVTPITDAQVGSTTLPDLAGATITEVTSTTSTMDAGLAPMPGGGIEVRWSDAGWGPYNDQNLVGRFTTQTFTLPRLGRTQDYYLRQFDGATLRRYSRASAALHLDYPY